MRHISLFLIIAAALGLLLTACSDTIAPTDPDPYAKKPPILIPPPGWDPFMGELRMAFSEVEWVDVELTFNRLTTGGGTVSAVPKDYPQHLPITLTYTGGDPTLGDGYPAEWTCTIVVPAQPPQGGFLDVPNGCLIYKYKDFPPPNAGDVVLGLPVNAWNDPSSYTGTFNSFIVEADADDWWFRTEEESVTVPWPPEDPGDPIYVTIHGDPGTEGGDRTGDGVIEPVDPADPDKR